MSKITVYHNDLPILVEYDYDPGCSMTFYNPGSPPQAEVTDYEFEDCQEVIEELLDQVRIAIDEDFEFVMCYVIDEGNCIHIDLDGIEVKIVYKHDPNEVREEFYVENNKPKGEIFRESIQLISYEIIDNEQNDRLIQNLLEYV